MVIVPIGKPVYECVLRLECEDELPVAGTVIVEIQLVPVEIDVTTDEGGGHLRRVGDYRALGRELRKVPGVPSKGQLEAARRTG